MVIGDDIAVGADDDTAATAFLLPHLGRVLIAEEETEEGIYTLVLLTVLDGHLYIDHGLHGAFGRVGKVRIVGFCQIDSTIFHGVAFGVSDYSGLRGGFGCFHYTIGR